MPPRDRAKSGACAALACLLSAASANSEPVERLTGNAMANVRGQLVARAYTTLSAEISGKLAAVSVKDGDAYKAGSVLIRIDCALQRAQHQETVAAFAIATKTRQVNQRLSQLNSTSSLELEIALSEEAKAKARVDAAEAILSKCEIRAPFDGKVAELRAQPLQYVQPGQPILDLVDDGAFEVVFLAPSRWLRWLERGQEIQIHLDETGRAYGATVVRIGARVDAVSETVKVYAAILNNAPELVAGMSGAVRFLGRTN